MAKFEVLTKSDEKPTIVTADRCQQTEGALFFYGPVGEVYGVITAIGKDQWVRMYLID